MSSKKSPKSSIRTAAGNVSYRWKAAKYFLMSSSSFTYLEQKANKIEYYYDDEIIEMNKVGEILHLYTVEDMRRWINSLKFRKERVRKNEKKKKSEREEKRDT